MHQHASTEAAIFANAYIVEGETSVVVVDATLTVSEANALRSSITAIGKPLAAVLLTHGHPDHYNGAAILVGEDDVPIIAMAGVDAIIRQDDQAKEEQWKPVFGDEWPSERSFPTVLVADGERIEFDDLSFVVHDVGPAESHYDSYWVLEAPEPAAFVGDLVFNGVHAYLADGHSTKWLDLLDRLERDLADMKVIYPGHGASGSPALLAEQRQYLTLYRD
ncbi:MAG: MBL fold metallo-hydrolase, partial [Myxococcota bacterium]